MDGSLEWSGHVFKNKQDGSQEEDENYIPSDSEFSTCSTTSDQSLAFVTTPTDGSRRSRGCKLRNKVTSYRNHSEGMAKQAQVQYAAKKHNNLKKCISHEDTKSTMRSGNKRSYLMPTVQAEGTSFNPISTSGYHFMKLICPVACSHIPSSSLTAIHQKRCTVLQKLDLYFVRDLEIICPIHCKLVPIQNLKYHLQRQHLTFSQGPGNEICELVEYVCLRHSLSEQQSLDNLAMSISELISGLHPPAPFYKCLQSGCVWYTA
jgi:hypothetical protein